MNTVRLSSGMSDTDKIGKLVQCNCFELNGREILSIRTFDVLPEFFGILTCANAEELRDKMQLH